MWSVTPLLAKDPNPIPTTTNTYPSTYFYNFGHNFFITGPIFLIQLLLESLFWALHNGPGSVPFFHAIFKDPAADQKHDIFFST